MSISGTDLITFKPITQRNSTLTVRIDFSFKHNIRQVQINTLMGSAMNDTQKLKGALFWVLTETNSWGRWGRVNHWHTKWCQKNKKKFELWRINILSASEEFSLNVLSVSDIIKLIKARFADVGAASLSQTNSLNAVLC